MDWPQTLTIIAAVGGLIWLFTRQTNKRIDDLRTETYQAHAQIGKRLDDMRSDVVELRTAVRSMRVAGTSN